MKILDLIFPKQCINCGKIGEYLCKDCKKQLKPHREMCSSCHKYSNNYETCLECKSAKEFLLDGILIPFSYTGFLKKIILKLKYYHKKDVVDFLIDRVVIAIHANNILNNKLSQGNVVVSGIPSHWHRRYFVKGYNQSYLLAKNLSKKLGLEYKVFLKKTKKTKSQASLDRAGRLQNLKNAFDFKGDVSFLESTKTVILVDDITTTGSTMNEIAKLIKSKFPKISIWGVVLGRKDS
ncbi:MAG TPA: phosphoribosyltransferase family protein [Candidatus Absconditabacterales bacterium]|nr:phosphoribosyltransferase family protein [Candidatus Absconditabacterales bacterium]